MSPEAIDLEKRHAIWYMGVRMSRRIERRINIAIENSRNVTLFPLIDNPSADYQHHVVHEGIDVWSPSNDPYEKGWGRVTPFGILSMGYAINEMVYEQDGITMRRDWLDCWMALPFVLYGLFDIDERPAWEWSLHRRLQAEKKDAKRKAAKKREEAIKREIHEVVELTKKQNCLIAWQICLAVISLVVMGVGIFISINW